MPAYLMHLLEAVKNESIVLMIGDVFITAAFLVEGIGIMRSKHITMLPFCAYLLFTFGSIMWFSYGIISNNYWALTVNGIAVCIQLCVLILILATKIKQALINTKHP